MRFLFCSLDSPGLLYPSVGIAKELIRRGHSVAFVTDVSYAVQLNNLGLQRIPCGSTDGRSFRTAIWPVPLAVGIQFKHIEYALDRFCPDILVGQHLTFGPLLIGERYRLPVASMGSCTYLFPSWDVTGNAKLSGIRRIKAWRFRDMLSHYNEIRSLLGFQCLSPGCRDALIGDLFMVRSVPELEGPPGNLPDQVQLVGSCLWEDQIDDVELDKWLEDADRSGEPVIYVQHGRFFEAPSFWSDIVRSLGRKSMRVVASINRMDSDVGAVPTNFFVRPHVPQSRVLRKAKVVVSSANTTVVLGALAAGVPCLLIPAGGEQPDVAERCEAVGVARVISPSEVSKKCLISEMQALLKDRNVRKATARLARAFAKIDGFRVAAGFLEGLGGFRPRVPRRQDLCTQGRVTWKIPSST